MFRDLKEYQEIAKIYAEKVSKPAEVESDELVENQENRKKLQKQRTELNKGRVEKQFGFLKPKPRNLKPGQTSVRQSGVNDPRRKKETPIPSTDQIRKENPKVVPGTRVNEIGAEGGGKPSEGNFKKQFPDKKPDPKPEISTTTKQGKPRTKAQMMAAKRIASGKTIADVKKANTDSMKAKAAERHKAFLAAKEAKKNNNEEVEYEVNEKMNPGSGRDTVNEPGALKVYRNIRTVGNLLPAIGKSLTGDKDAFKNMERKEVERYKNPKGIERVATGIADKLTGDKFDFDKRGPSKRKERGQTNVQAGYEYDAYDLVLEYLLSSEQAATIEEANYVMTEMDAETIQGIVEEQKKNLMKEQG